MLQLRPSSTLDGGDFGWPKAKHHFAVSPGFQISLRPRVNGREPRWSTRRFPKTDRANQLVVLASGTPDDIDAPQSSSRALKTLPLEIVELRRSSRSVT
jgi:hypothetical protein